MKSKSKRASMGERYLTVIEMPESKEKRAGMYVPLTITQMLKLIRGQEKKFNSKNIYRSTESYDEGWTSEMMRDAIFKEIKRKNKLKDQRLNLCLGAPVYIHPFINSYPWNATALIINTTWEDVTEVLYELGFLDLLAVNQAEVKYEATVVSRLSDTSDLVTCELPIIMENDSNLPKRNSTAHGLSPLDYLYITCEATNHLEIKPHNPLVITNIQPMMKFRQ